MSRGRQKCRQVSQVTQASQVSQVSHSHVAHMVLHPMFTHISPHMVSRRGTFHTPICFTHLFHPFVSPMCFTHFFHKLPHPHLFNTSLDRFPPLVSSERQEALTRIFPICPQPIIVRLITIDHAPIPITRARSSMWTRRAVSISTRSTRSSSTTSRAEDSDPAIIQARIGITSREIGTERPALRGALLPSGRQRRAA